MSLLSGVCLKPAWSPGAKFPSRLLGRGCKCMHSPRGWEAVHPLLGWCLIAQSGAEGDGTDHHPHLTGKLCDCGSTPMQSWAIEAQGVHWLFSSVMWRRCRDPGPKPNWMERMTWCGPPELGPQSHTNLPSGLQDGRPVSVVAREVGQVQRSGLEYSCHLLAVHLHADPSSFVLGLCERARAGQAVAA